MSDQKKTKTATDEPSPTLPPAGLKVPAGKPASGFKEPMPAERRNWYRERIEQSIDTQAAGAEKAAQLFIR